MFRHLFPFRRLLATSFLLVFVNVFVGQCWCATMMPPLRAGLPAPPAATPRAAEAPAKPTHPGCPGHGVAKKVAPKATEAHHPAKSSKPSRRGSDCCQDESASLLSSLTTPTEKQHFGHAPALLPTAPEYHFLARTAGSWDRTAAVRLLPPRHLPPKIPDIRIFIQSLTV